MPSEIKSECRATSSRNRGRLPSESAGIATFRPLAAADQFRKAYQNASGRFRSFRFKEMLYRQIKKAFGTSGRRRGGMAARMSGRRSSIARMTACRSAISGFISAVPPLNGASSRQ